MKRVFDFLIGLFGFLILSPLFLIISIIALADDGMPVIFKQDRVGKGNKIFKIYKFRTMKKGVGDFATGKLKDADKKITGFGKFLRKTSLDELPQFFNLINGTMSLVGPRPLIPSETKIRKLRSQYGIYDAMPGITGWAQVNGRDNISDEEKVKLDREYIEKQSLAFDLKIIFMTVKSVITRADINDGEEKDNKKSSK